MKRGRISSAELSTVVIDAGRRMPSPPPPELTDAQATVWRDVVGSLPDDWFTRAAHPILIAFCRLATHGRSIQMGQFQTSGAPQAKVRSSLNNGHVATASTCRFRARSCRRLAAVFNAAAASYQIFASK